MFIWIRWVLLEISGMVREGILEKRMCFHKHLLNTYCLLGLLFDAAYSQITATVSAPQRQWRRHSSTEQDCKCCCEGKHREAWTEEMIPELLIEDWVGLTKVWKTKVCWITGTANTSVHLDSRVQLMIRQVALKSTFPKRVGNKEV